MTLPRKASRDIEVEGKIFRWMVKRVGDRKEGVVRLTVEDPETKKIEQRMFRGIGIRGVEAHDPPRVTPGDVKQFIHERFLDE